MTLTRLAPAVFTFLPLALALVFGLPRAGSIEGTWRGDIILPEGGLAAVVHIEPDGEGGWTGTADTPTQGAWGIPLAEVTCTPEGVFTMTIPLTGARYDAQLSEDGEQLLGSWTQNGQSLPLDCTRQTAPAPMPESLRHAVRGTWEGLLETGPVDLRLRLEFTERADGALRGSFVSPDQSPQAYDITRTDLLPDERLRVCVGSIALVLEVGVSADGTQLEGTFRQGAAALPILLKHVEQATELFRPQHPVGPRPYRSEEVEFPGGVPAVRLAGTLTLPPGEGPHPAALLISGSGPQDRDETIFGHKPFWVLADDLTRRGIAVLRVDDRGVGASTASATPHLDTTIDLVGDARAAVEFLRARTDIGVVGLVGHSEGGLIAPLLAAEDPEVAFIVLLASPGVRGGDLLYMQIEALNRASGTTGAALESGLALQRELMDIVADPELIPEQAEARLRAALEGDPSFAELEGAQAAVDAALAQLRTPWLIWFVRHDPGPVLARVQCPVLALNGSLDLQVPSEPNLAALRAALEAGGNADFTLHELAGLNHLFQHAETGLVTEYGRLQETFAPQALERVGAWITQRCVE